ncbi:MAG: GAF domain-containing protein [Candidatus Merdivicinus sp.]|jgi:L-methionine (R)-S-oxide reductase
MNDFYKQLCLELKALTEDCSFVTTNLANAAALLFERLENVNWVGFYLKKDSKLLLGPFCGKPACRMISIGRGVCGTAAEKLQTIRVPDVHVFPGHIACDSASRSELVIPILKKGTLLGVLDIDSPFLNRFDAEDQSGLEQIAAIVSSLSGWNTYHLL